MLTPTLYPRHITHRLAEALRDTPVVLLSGPRQAGKTTLVRRMATEGMRYITLDDESNLLSAREDPVGMIRSLDCAVIDEVQRAPQLLLAIKKSVDEDRRPGRFLLTGSANLMALPTVADSLAGRMEMLTLLPLSQSEIEESSLNWIDHVFKGQIPQSGKQTSALQERVLRGGYPEAVARMPGKRRTAWAQQYLQALIQRDVRDIAQIDKLDQLPRFLRCLAQTAGQMCNYAQLGAQVGLDGKTAAKYIGIFEQLYLLRRMDVWAKNRLNRAVKTPKLQFIDSGLLCHLLELGSQEVQHDRSRFGHALESFVYGELLKLTSTADGDYKLLYYRDADKVEVDIVIENAAGQWVGIEVKASATVKASDLKGLRKLASLSAEQFKMGILLYDGDETLPFGNGIWAVPLPSLWGRA